MVLKLTQVETERVPVASIFFLSIFPQCKLHLVQCTHLPLESLSDGPVCLGDLAKLQTPNPFFPLINFKLQMFVLP